MPAKVRNELLKKLILPSLIMVFAIYYLIEIQTMPGGDDQILIVPVILIMVVLFLVIFYKEWRAAKESIAKTPAKEEGMDELIEDESAARWSKKSLSFIVLVALHLFMMNLVGFIFSTMLFIAALMWVLGNRSRKAYMIVPISVVLIIQILFVEWLSIPLPTLF